MVQACGTDLKEPRQASASGQARASGDVMDNTSPLPGHQPPETSMSLPNEHISQLEPPVEREPETSLSHSPGQQSEMQEASLSESTESHEPANSQEREGEHLQMSESQNEADENQLSPFLLDHSMQRTSPEGSPAHSLGGTPVVKRVQFAVVRDVEDVSLDMRNDERTGSHEHKVAPSARSSCEERVDFAEFEEEIVNEPQSGLSSLTAYSNKDTLVNEPTTNNYNTTVVGHKSPRSTIKPVNGVISHHEPRVEGLVQLRPPSASKKWDMLPGARCQWACCCGLGWFMIGAVAMTAGVMLVAYLHTYWMSDVDSSLSVLLYLGTGLCILGGLTLLIGLGFWTCACIIWTPNKGKKNPGPHTKEHNPGPIRRTKYVVNTENIPTGPAVTTPQDHVISSPTVAMPRDDVRTDQDSRSVTAEPVHDDTFLI